MIANDINMEYVSAKMSASSEDAAFMICSGVTPSTPGDVPFLLNEMGLLLFGIKV